MTTSLMEMEVMEILDCRDRRRDIEGQLSERGWKHYFYKTFRRSDALFRDVEHYCRTDSKLHQWLLIIDWIHSDYELYKMDSQGNLP